MNSPIKKSKVRKPQAIDLNEFELGERKDFFLHLYEFATGAPVRVPFIVARGKLPGPVLGITAALHGNELNGIKIIQNLLEDLDLETLRGTLVCAPVVNVPGFDRGQRYFSDGLDLNNYFPGKFNGQPAEQYARSFVSTFLPPIDYLVDIHTASQGRLNTLYVRVDREAEKANKMAKLFNPEIILQSKGGDGTLRNAAKKKGIPSITVEAGNPNVLQGKMVFDGENGVKNIMRDLEMIEGDIKLTRKPVICKSSSWIRTTGGGLLEIKFGLGDKINKKQLLAYTIDPFGNILQEYFAPYAGIVIGRAAYPVAIPGTRFCHLGKIEEKL